MKQSPVAVHLQTSLLEEARKLAVLEGVELSSLVNVALAEKLSALRTEAFFREKRAGADTAKALAILAKAGADAPPREDDHLPRS